MASVAPPGRAAAAQGLSGASNLVGASLMAFISPWVYGEFGSEAAFISVAVVMLLVSLLARSMAVRHKLI
jgi:nitrate/nitrite transporter NarK